VTTLRRALHRAWEARATLHAAADTTSAYRLFDGRYEGAQGWTVDRYGRAVLVQNFHPEGAAEAELETLLGFLRDQLGEGGSVFLKERSVRVPERAVGRQIWGEGPSNCEVIEDGLRFGVEFLHGANTGLFLDARPLRAWVRDHSAGRRVLNLFSYTGAFGVAAAAGGARSVTNVDIVPSAIARGRANFERNSLASDSRTHMKAEVFDFLRRAARAGQTWDAIIADPPPVPTTGRRGKKKRGRGFDPSADIERLMRLAYERLAGGGWLLACSALRGTERFEERLPEDIGGRRRIDRGLDFPGPPDEGLRAWVLPRPPPRAGRSERTSSAARGAL
jgi:23S rRNA (cytosine1962-C5)-methyltransferase